MNYIASVFFACVALGLIGAYAIANGDQTALVVVVLGAGAAWASCYTGAVYFASGDRIWHILSYVFFALAFVLIALAWFGAL